MRNLCSLDSATLHKLLVAKFYILSSISLNASLAINKCHFFFFQESELSFSYPASTDSDETLVAGRWKSDDSELKPYRTVLVLSADKFDKALEGINTLLTQ